MKKSIIVVMAFMSIGFMSCQEDEMPVIEKNAKEIEVGLAFDNFYPDYSSKPMSTGRESVFEAWQHNISEEMAVVTIDGQSPAGDPQIIKLSKEFNLLHELRFTLKVGWEYKISIDPEDPYKMSTSNTIFYGESDVFIMPDTAQDVQISCSTPQSLVLIADTYIHGTEKPKVEFYSDNTYTTVEAEYGLGISQGCYAMYVTDLNKAYRFVIRKEDGEYANVKIYNLVAGRQYEIMPRATTSNSGSLDLDIDAAFEVIPVDI